MPNWCMNNLRISGPAEALKRFKEASKTRPQYYTDLGWDKTDNQAVFSLSGTFPIPEVVLQNWEKYEKIRETHRKECEKIREGVPEDQLENLVFPPYPAINQSEAEQWYYWCVQNWGTKWDVSPTNIEDNENEEEWIVSFDSAWSPPIEWLEKVCQDYRELSFNLEYCEPGMNFVGEAVAEDGDCTEDTHEITDADKDNWPGMFDDYEEDGEEEDNEENGKEDNEENGEDS